MTLETPIWLQGGTYSARQDRSLLDVIFTEGVIDPGGGALAASQRAAGANDSVDVAAGAAIITGDDEANQGKYYVRNTATINVAFSPAPGSDERIDLLVLRVNDPTAGGPAGNNATLAVVEGTVAASAVAPAVPDTAIAIAEVLRTAGDTSITTAMITDVRPAGVFANAVERTIVDAKGDLIVATGADAVARRAVGSNGQRLVADSAEATGVKWVADTINTVIDAKGDLIAGTGADTAARLAVGTNGQVLTADSSAATGLAWASPAGPSDISVYCYQTSGTVLTTSVWTELLFQAEQFDTDSMHSTSTQTDKIYCQTAGKYLIGGTATAGTNRAHGVRIVLNGTTVIAGNTMANSALAEQGTAVTLYDLAVNDYVQLQANWNFTGSLSSSGNEQTNFWAVKVA